MTEEGQESVTMMLHVLVQLLHTISLIPELVVEVVQEMVFVNCRQDNALTD